MMTKQRSKKAQRLEAAKEDLRQRIADVYAGACGRHMDSDDELVSPEELSRIIPAVRWIFGEPHLNWYGWNATALDKWVTIDLATDLLFKADFRADEEWLTEDEKKEQASV